MKILGVKVDDVDVTQAVHKVEEWLEGNKSKIFTLVTPNPEIIVQAQADPKLHRIVNEADLAVPDGVGIIWASQIGSRFKAQGSRLKEVVTGVELMRELCRLAAEKGWVVGLYGGRGGVAERALQKLQQKYYSLEGWVRTPPEVGLSKIKMYVRGDFRQNSAESILEKEIRWLEKKVVETRTRLLFVALGVPKQEYLMDILLKAQGSNLILMAVGGAFDELSGKVRPTPGWVRGLGLKWLWRLVWQPWRLKRQLRLVKFVWLVLKERYGR